MHGDEDAARLRGRSYLLSEFLVAKAPNFAIPRLPRKAIVHGHCHQKAVLRIADEEQMLGKLGVDCTVLDSGCCGMAGAFGFEKGEHYDVSIECGERVNPKAPAIPQQPSSSQLASTPILASTVSSGSVPKIALW